MDHDAHLAENVDQAGASTKVIALVVLVVALFGAAGYVFFGPGF